MIKWGDPNSSLNKIEIARQRREDELLEAKIEFHRKMANRHEELDKKVAPFRTAVYNLGLEPSDNDVQSFINFLSNVEMYAHKFVFDTLRAGWEIIISSNKVSAEQKKKARLALLRVSVYIK